MSLKYALLAKSVSARSTSAFVCLRCRFQKSASVSLRNTNPSSYSYGSHHGVQRRLVSTASATAINAKKPIPPPFQELHATLSALNDEASIYANESQLQLALRGLELENPVTRLAGKIVFGSGAFCKSGWDDADSRHSFRGQRTTRSSSACAGSFSGSFISKIRMGVAAFA